MAVQRLALDWREESRMSLGRKRGGHRKTTSAPKKGMHLCCLLISKDSKLPAICY